RFDFYNAFADFENRNVEGAAAKIKHRDRLVLLLVQAISERRGGWLIYDSHNFEPRDLAGVLGSLTLRVIEIRRNSDDRLSDFLAEIVFSSLFELLQDHRRDLRRRPFFSTRLNPYVIAGSCNFVGHHLHFFAYLIEAPPHKALD